MSKAVLYKYRAINDRSIESLKTKKMWFSVPAKLNDTFEFSVPFFVHLSPEELVELFEKRFKVEYVANKLLDAMMEFGGGTSFPATDAFVKEFLNQTSGPDRAIFG